MAFKIADRVQETSTSTGTGAFDLNGAVAGYQSFIDAIGDSNTTYYAIVASNGQWEVGSGSVAVGVSGNPNRLSRVEVIDGSSGIGVLVDFANLVDAKDVFVTLPAEKFLLLTDSGDLSVAGGMEVGGDLSVVGTITLNGIEYTFPATQAANRYLKTDGSGHLSWGSILETLSLTDLSDVTITSPTNGQFLAYNAGSWVNTSVLGVANGGSGLSTSTLGDLRYGSGANTIAALAGNTTSTKKFLAQTGTGTVSAAPAWSTLAAADIPTLDTSILGTGTLGTARGGTGLSSYTLGDLLYSSAANTLATLAGNTTSTKKFLTQTGTGSASAAPVWGGVAAADVAAGTFAGAFTFSSALAATLSTAAQPNVTSLGTLTALATSGSITSTLGTVTSSTPTFTSTATWNASGVTFVHQFVNITSTASAAGSLLAQWQVGGADMFKVSKAGTATAIAFSGDGSALTNLTAANIAGTLGVTHGGTGIASVSTGDLLYGSASNTLAALAGNSAASNKWLRSTGTGSAAQAPTWSAIVAADITDLTTASTGITSLGTVTTGTWSATAIAATKGGTGLTAYTTGDVLYSSATNVLSALAGNTSTTNKFLRSTGSGSAAAAPSWQSLVAGDIPNHSAALITSGTLATTVGGTGLATYTLGDLLYASASNTLAALAGNTTSTKKFLSQTGTGTVSAAPSWVTLAAADIGAGTFTGAFTFASSITGSITGNAGSATVLQTARSINGVSFDGSASITVTAAANTLTGTTLASGVVSSSLTSVGTLTALSTSGTITSTLGTITTSTPWRSSTATWNASGTTFIHDFINITSTASASGSLIAQWQVGGTDMFKVSKGGTVTAVAFVGDGSGLTGISGGVTGTVQVNQGGTNITSYTLGDLLYASNTTVLSKLAGNTSATKQFLTQTGTGSVSAAPAWGTIGAADVGAGTFSGSFTFGSTLTVSGSVVASGTASHFGGTDAFFILTGLTPPAVLNAGSFGAIGNGAAGILRLYRTNGYAVNTAVGSAANLGQTVYGGFDGSGFGAGASIVGTTTEAWTSTAHGTKLVFNVVPNGSTTSGAALTLDQDKSATFAGLVTASLGLTVSSGQTLTLSGVTVSGAPTYGSTQTLNTSGNAGTATALQTARNINGVSFSGTADITVAAAAGTLTGGTLAAGVTASSLTSVGTLSSLAVSGSASIAGALALGSNAASTGLIRIPNANALVARNAANSGDINLLSLNGSNQVSIDVGGAGAVFGGTVQAASSITSAGTFTSTIGNNNPVLTASSATTGYSYINIQNTSGRGVLAVAASDGTFATGTLAYATVVGALSNTPLDFVTNNTRRGGFAASGTFDVSSGVMLLNSPASNPQLAFQKAGTTTASIVSDAASTIKLLDSGGSTVVTFASGALSLSTLTVATSPTADASMGVTSSEGLVLRAKAGSSYDFSLIAPSAATYFLRVPTGTANVQFASGVTTAGTLAVNGSTLTSVPLSVKAATNLDLMVHSASSGTVLGLSAVNDANAANVPLGFFATYFQFNSGAVIVGSDPGGSAAFRVSGAGFFSGGTLSVAISSGNNVVLEKGTGAFVQFQRSGTNNFGIGALNGDGGAFYYGPSNTEGMRLTSVGVLAVGTTVSGSLTAGNIIIPEGRGYSSTTNAGGTMHLIEGYWDGGADRVLIDTSSFGVITGGNLRVSGEFYGGGASFTPFAPFHFQRVSNGGWLGIFENTSAVGCYGIQVNTTGVAANNSTTRFIESSDSSTVRFRVFSNGGIANFSANNSNLSDERVKNMGEVIDGRLASDVFAALGRGKVWQQFKYKDQTHQDWNLGFGLQTMERVLTEGGFGALVPSLIDKDGWTDKNGNVLWSAYETDLTHLALAAVSNHADRLEYLESRVLELEHEVERLKAA